LAVTASLTGGRIFAATLFVAAALTGALVWPRHLRVHVESGERLRSPAIDRDGDGYPDGAQLVSTEDRDAFRGWFVSIALRQATDPCPCWDAAQRDCAGLVRFAFREALKRHDAAWRARLGAMPGAPARDVRRYAYPDVPVLGDHVFRVRGGAFRGLEDFDVAPTADRLVAGSLVRRSADEPWESGDLLYFTDRTLRLNHLMILAGDRVVYHTGASGQGGGEVRVVTLDELRRHPDSQWHPDASNPAFAGVFRWKILGN
jgi:uncharacterized protein